MQEEAELQVARFDGEQWAKPTHWDAVTRTSNGLPGGFSGSRAGSGRQLEGTVGHAEHKSTALCLAVVHRHNAARPS